MQVTAALGPGSLNFVTKKKKKKKEMSCEEVVISFYLLNVDKV